MAQGDTALDRAKRVQSTLCKLVERRERAIEKASGEFRLDMLAAVDAVDDETLGLVQRALAMDRDKPYLQLALQMAIDERNERNRQPHTQRSGGDDDDGHEAITEHPPRFEVEGDGGALEDLPPSAYAAGSVPLESDDAPIVISTPEQARALYGDGSAAESFLQGERGRAAPLHVIARGTAVLPDGATVQIDEGEFRYPEPGEPAVELPDGTVIAAP